MPIATKICLKCYLEKPIDNFSKNKAKKSGYQGYCKPCKSDLDKGRRMANREASLEYSRLDASKRYKQNPKKYLERNKKWAAANPNVRIEIKARRRARKLNASPKWINKFFISEIYHLAKLREISTGIKWHVDHIIPLVNDKVCGLHCEFNLQLLPATLNLQKHNKF